MKVSVVMAVHNGLPYLEEALSSVLSQTFKDSVVIVVDDGSTDGSLEYLRKVTDSRLRVMAVQHQRRRGACQKHWNRILQLRIRSVYGCGRHLAPGAP